VFDTGQVSVAPQAHDAVDRLARAGLVQPASALPGGSVAPAPSAPAPVPPADEPLPVLPALTGLLPGLPRGGVVQVEAMGALVPALLAGASQAGSWCAVVGVPEFGVAAAEAMGVDLGRTVFVDTPGSRWDEATSVLIGGVDVVVVRPELSRGTAPAPDVTRRLVALARRYGTTLLVLGSWDGAGLRLEVASSLWTGLGRGEGRLRGCRVQVIARGRGAAGRPRRAWLWLPGPDGQVAEARSNCTDQSNEVTLTDHVVRGVGSARGAGRLRRIPSDTADEVSPSSRDPVDLDERRFLR